MRDDIHADSAPSPSGGLIRLQAHAADLGGWLGPTWATLCGALASNAFGWQGGDWLHVALLLLLVDAGWGTLWAALSGTAWALPIRRWRTWHKNREIAKLPYTLPGTPGDRISHWMGRLRTWWRAALWPTCGSAIRAVLVALPVTALLGALLGPESLLLSGAALALMQLGVIWASGRGAVSPGWDGVIAIALPWLVGHATLGAVTLPSAGLAILFALSWGSAWNTTSRRARGVLVASQLLCAACLVVLHRPLAAGALSLLSVPQIALLPWVRLDLSATRFARYTRLGLMAAMAVAALAL